MAQPRIRRLPQPLLPKGLSCCQISAVRSCRDAPLHRFRGEAAVGEGQSSDPGAGAGGSSAPSPHGAPRVPPVPKGSSRRCIPNPSAVLGSPRAEGHTVNPALGALPGPVRVPSAVSRGQAWAGRWQEGTGCSRPFPAALEGCSEPVWPPCPALLLPLAVGPLPDPKQQRTTHFSKGCSQRPGSCGHCPLLLPSPAGPFPLPRRVQSLGRPGLASNATAQLGKLPSPGPHGDGTAVPALGGFLGSQLGPAQAEPFPSTSRARHQEQ